MSFLILSSKCNHSIAGNFCLLFSLGMDWFSPRGKSIWIFVCFAFTYQDLFGRLSVSKRTASKNFMDGTYVTHMPVDAMTSDVIAPSPWKIFGCQNGKGQNYFSVNA